MPISHMLFIAYMLHMQYAWYTPVNNILSHTVMLVLDDNFFMLITLDRDI